MFGFLKDKLKGALKAFSKGVEDKGKTEEKVVEVEKPVEKIEIKEQPKEKPAPVQSKPQRVESAQKPQDKPELTKEKKVQEKSERSAKPKERILPVAESKIELETPPRHILPESDDESKEPQEEISALTQTLHPHESPRTEEKSEVVEVKEEAPQNIAKPESKSFFSKITSVFKKKDEYQEDGAQIDKKEPPKIIVESTRITPEGKIVEEKTIVQAKEDGEEEKPIPAPKNILDSAKPTVPESKPVAQRQETNPVERRQEKVSTIADAKPEKSHRTDKPVAPTHEEKPKSFFERITQVITTKTISQEQFDELFFDLELAMLENNVAVQVIEKLKADLQKSIVGVPIKRGEVEQKIIDTLRDSITDLLSIPVPSLLDLAEKKKPYIIAFIGVNGAGKTTNLAKIAHYLQKHDKSVVIAACDTFRAAAIHQLEEHANNLGVKVIKHDYGADAAAVAFDAVAHAKSKGIDVVLVDTAGRLHSNSNLMDELAKIERVIKPDLKLFVGESVTGNDCIEQAMQFNEKVGIDGIILSKADVDEKGGAAISVSYVTQKPIFFIGTGQTYDDLQPFSKDKVLESLEL